MKPRERILCVLAGDVPDRVPYYEASIDYPWICRLFGRDIDGTENFDSGEYRTNDLADQLEVNRILHRDNLTYCCLPRIPAVKRAGKDQILFFEEGEIGTWEDLEAFHLPDVTTSEFRRPLEEFVTAARASDHAAVAQTRCGISATYLAMGFERFFLMLLDDPDLVESLMRRYAEWTARLVPVLAQAGFDIVHTADDVCGGSGPLVSPELYRQRFWPHVRKIADAIRATDLKWCFHSDGDLRRILPDLLDMGIDMLNPVEPGCMDIVELKRCYGGRLVLSGNVDVDLLARGEPGDVERCVRLLLRDVAPGGGYLLASGNSVASYTRVDNVLRMCETNYRVGRYPMDVG